MQKYGNSRNSELHNYVKNIVIPGILNYTTIHVTN